MPAVAASLCAIGAMPSIGQVPDAFGVCTPRSQRGERTIGCFIIAEQKLGRIEPNRVFWHVTRFDTPAAATAAKITASVAGTVLDAFGATWLLTISGSAWRSKAGRQVAVIGPLPISAGVDYAALYMEASMTPGMKYPVA